MRRIEIAADTSHTMSAERRLKRIGVKGSCTVSEGIKSPEEIAEAIRSLSDADWIRLKKIAQLYARVVISPEDLLQEAFLRALNGDRRCPASVDVVKFLAEAMRSIGDAEQQKLASRMEAVGIDEGTDVSSSVENPEDQIASANQYASVRKDILSLFEDDLAAKDIVEGTIEDFTAEELRELTDLDKRAYDTKRKLIRRRIDKRYPEGWQP